MATLYVPLTTSPTIGALSEEASTRGLLVRPIGIHDDPSSTLTPGAAHLFGGPMLAEHVQRQVSLALLEPRDDWLPRLPDRFLLREVRLVPAIEAYALPDRWFVKMPREKALEPGPYVGHELPALPADEPLLVSELVRMTSEWRFWILDGIVHASSSYRRNGYPDARPLAETAEGASVLAFVDDLLDDQADQLPSAVVIDVAWVEHPRRGWAVVEANMAWFSSHYAGDPGRVLDVVLRAAGPRDAVADRDLPYSVRPAADLSPGRAAGPGC